MATEAKIQVDRTRWAHRAELVSALVRPTPTKVAVIPCYNERERLAGEVFLRYAFEGTHLVFVDDGSTDGTGELLADLATRSEGRIGVLTMHRNGGKAAAVQAGLRHAISMGADVVGYLDADLATPVEEFHRLLEIQERTGADAVLGSRVGMAGYQIDRTRLRGYLGRVFAFAASTVLGFQVHDTQCGAKVFPLSYALLRALREPFATELAFDVELLARMRQADPEVRYLEVPLRSWTDVRGSKVHFTDMVEASLDLVRLARTRANPVSSVEQVASIVRERSLAG